MIEIFRKLDELLMPPHTIHSVVSDIASELAVLPKSDTGDEESHAARPKLKQGDYSPSDEYPR